MTANTLSQDALARLAAVIESRKVANGGDPNASYVARLLHKGPDAFLKKIGEEATEVVIAAKNANKAAQVHELTDLWFHMMVLMAALGIELEDIEQELGRRFGHSGLVEKASRVSA